jgi:hypothetical protein
MERVSLLAPQEEGAATSNFSHKHGRSGPVQPLCLETFPYHFHRKISHLIPKFVITFSKLSLDTFMAQTQTT